MFFFGKRFEDPAMPSDAANIPRGSQPQPPIYRWECGCRRPPILLATFDLSGRIEIAQQDRYWQVNGQRGHPLSDVRQGAPAPAQGRTGGHRHAAQTLA